MGFKEVQEIDKFAQDNEYGSFGDRFDYNEWKDSTDPLEILTVLSTNNLVPRYINRISPGSHIIEDSLYDKSTVENHPKACVFPSQIDRLLINSTNNYIQTINCQPIRRSDIEFMIKTDMTSQNFFQYGLSKFDGIPIGEILNETVNKFFKHFELDGNVKPEPSISQLYLKFLKPCEIFFLPPASMGIKGTHDHKPPCWISLNCKYCKKKCLIKRENGIESNEDFLLKALVGTWASHIFCYEPNSNSSEWNEANKDWFTCEKRVKSWFGKLKKAQHSDAVFFDQKNKPEGYMYLKSSLEKVIKVIVDKYDNYLIAITSYLVDLRIKCLETMKKDLETITISDESDSSKEEKERNKKLKLAQQLIQEKIRQLQRARLTESSKEEDSEHKLSKSVSVIEGKRKSDKNQKEHISKSETTLLSGKKDMNKPDDDEEMDDFETPLSQLKKKQTKKKIEDFQRRNKI